VARFVDSNVLLRYFTEDIPSLARIAEEIIESDDKLVVSAIVLSEVSYVLHKEYGRSRDEILEVLVEFLQRENVSVIDARKELVVASFSRARETTKLSFGDALILAQMRSSGIKEIYSFDKDFRDPAIDVLEAPVAQ
jgi:predicted nucleic acid-binding protein